MPNSSTLDLLQARISTTTNVRRRVATPGTIAAAASSASVAEISRALVDRVYGVSQAELAEVLEIQDRQAADEIRLEMLLGKMLQAHTQGAPVQPGRLTLLGERAKVNASVSWKAEVEALAGKEYAASKLAAAQAEARLKVGALRVRVVEAASI